MAIPGPKQETSQRWRLPIVVTMVVLGRELMAAPWWVWGAFALASLALLALLRMKGRNIGA
jgi:hypothetical protein